MREKATISGVEFVVDGKTGTASLFVRDGWETKEGRFFRNVAFLAERAGICGGRQAGVTREDALEMRRRIAGATGEIGEKITYQLKATYLGLDDSPSAPSRDVSHMVTINGMTPFYGDERGMYFTISCSGEIETTLSGDPNSTMFASSRPYFGVSQAWQGQFSGNTIKVIVEELVASSGGGSTWRPVFTSYDWTQQGILPTYRFSKRVTYELGWNTIAQLRPTTGEKFIRVKATIDYFGKSQVVTDQVSLSGSGTEWTSANTDGYRVFRLTGGYGGKG